MSYTLDFKQSPNYTPGNQTQAAYGQPRSIKLGAGHWWNLPTAGARHDGIIATFMNPARQASAHAVLSDGRVTEMVRDGDTSWATNHANPFTYSIEVDPRIMYKWEGGGDSALAERIFNTLCEYIADKGFHNILWYPHNHWKSTQCNPIRWNEVMAGAKAAWSAKHTPVVAEWKKNLKLITPDTLLIVRDEAPLRNLQNPSQVIKTFKKGTPMEIVAETVVKGHVYKLTRYAYENGTGQGFDTYELAAKAPEQPEWIKNLKDISPVKLMVIPAQTAIMNLSNDSVVKQLGQGTWIDFVKSTTVGGKEYLISSYSATNTIPNGILKSTVGIPDPVVIPPTEPEKPEWLTNWEDIEDVVMYTRADTDLVDLLDGKTIQSIPRGTEIEIASSTEWHGQAYLITKYSTDKKVAAGIRLEDLDMKPVEVDPPVIPTDPEKTTDELIRENNSILNWLKDQWESIFKKKG